MCLKCKKNKKTEEDISSEKQLCLDNTPCLDCDSKNVVSDMYKYKNHFAARVNYTCKDCGCQWNAYRILY